MTASPRSFASLRMTASPSLDLDANLLRLGLFLLRHLDLQHAVAVGGADALGVDGARKSEGTDEVAVGALDAVPRHAVAVLLELPLALDRQDAVLELDA